MREDNVENRNHKTIEDLGGTMPEDLLTPELDLK